MVLTGAVQAAVHLNPEVSVVRVRQQVAGVAEILLHFPVRTNTLWGIRLLVSLVLPGEADQLGVVLAGDEPGPGVLHQPAQFHPVPWRPVYFTHRFCRPDWRMVRNRLEIRWLILCRYDIIF